MRKGFTAIELLVVVSLVVLASVLIIQVWRASRSVKSVDAAVRDVASLIEKAQAGSIAGKNDTNYGVHLQTDRAVLFQGSTYVAGSATNETVLLPSGITIASVTLTGGGSDIVFDKLVGTTGVWGTTTIALVASSTVSASIVVQPTGLITVQ